MAWVSVHQEVDGSKLRRLYKTIGCSKFEALGILNFLWFWGMKNADETGLVSDADLEVLSRYLYGCGEGSTLDMGKVVQALADVGWIDMAADGFYIHDWDQWQGKTYKDDYRAILSWVVRQVNEDNPGLMNKSRGESAGASPGGDNPYAEWGEASE